MNCALCKTELTQPKSIQYGLCLECRLYPQAGATPQTEEQHDEAVELVQQIIKSTITGAAQ